MDEFNASTSPQWSPTYDDGKVGPKPWAGGQPDQQPNQRFGKWESTTYCGTT